MMRDSVFRYSEKLQIRDDERFSFFYNEKLQMKGDERFNLLLQCKVADER